MRHWPHDISLYGKHVSLVPLTQNHHDELVAATDGLEGLWYTTVPMAEGMRAEIDRRLALDNMQAFAMIGGGVAVGMTTYMRIDAENKRVEIGSTWLGKSAQRGPVNTEAKYLMLRHAFEVLDCIAVEFRTHFHNTQSRRAIERIGAKLDGVLRAHSVLENGTIRDTALYSIIAPEWPTVRAHLEWQLIRPRG